MENNNYYQEVIMSDEEKIQMYQGLEKEELIKMLMECNKVIKHLSKELQKHSIEKVIPLEKPKSLNNIENSLPPIMNSRSCYAACSEWEIQQGFCICENNITYE